MKKGFIKTMGGLRNDKRGVAAIEMAIILPVLILIIIGILVYGIYFIKFGLVSRSVSTTATAIQLNPNDVTLNGLAHSSGAVLVSYNSPNYICAMSYTTQAAAQSGKCTGTSWTTTAPAGVNTGTPYYVAVAAFVRKAPLVPLLSDLIPDIRSSAVVQVRNSPYPIPPVCGGSNTFLQFDGSNYSCRTVALNNPPTPPNCNGANQTLQYANGAYSCATVSAGSSGGGGGGGSGSTGPTPPICTGDGKALQWNGSAYVCVSTTPSGLCFVKNFTFNYGRSGSCPSGYSVMMAYPGGVNALVFLNAQYGNGNTSSSGYATVCCVQ